MESTQRRHDLDALRAFAMLLGIALHASLSFFPMPWPVQDTEQSGAYALFFSAIHGFRMPLFFLLSGYFTMMVYRKRGLAALLKQRSVRILIPCLVGLVTVVPLLHIVSGWAMQTAYPQIDSDKEPLISAIRSADASAVRALLKLDVDVQTPDSVFKNRPLNWACLVGDPEIVRLLLQHGADATQPNDDGNTPLHAAAFLGHAKVVELLLEQGADASAANRDGATALAAAGAPEEITLGIAKFLGLSAPEPDDLKAGRNQVRELLQNQLMQTQSNLATATSPDAAKSSKTWPYDIVTQYAAAMNSDRFRVTLSGASVHLFSSPIFDHLWFLWFLCWMVGLFTIGLWVSGWMPPTRPAAGDRASTSPMRAIWWLVPATILPQWFMGAAYPQFGPDTSAGLLPQPHLLVYYAIFFGFGVWYFACHEGQGNLGQRWWLLLPLGIFVAFPAGLATLGNRPLAAVIQPAYAWLMSIGLIGLFRASLGQPNAAIRYLSDASYWMYLVHLPLIVIGQQLVRTWNWPPVIKFAAINSAAVLLLLVSYQILVRHTWIGWILNGRVRRPETAAAARVH